MRKKLLLWTTVALCILGLAFSPSIAQRTAQGAGNACTEGLINGGFENDSGWNLPVTAYRAAYSQGVVRSGNRSLLAGIVAASENVFSYSSANQTVQLPAGILSATLALWWYPLSGEGPLAEAAGAVDEALLQAVVDGVAPATPLAGDRQYVILTNDQNRVIARLLWTRSNAQSWQQSIFDLTPYAGQTVRVHTGVYNDGVDGVTAMFVDDASVLVCQAEVAAGYLPFILREASWTVPPPAPTPPPSDKVWTDPPRAIEVFSPIPVGLYHSPIAVNGLSQTFEGSVNIRLTAEDAQVLAERATQGGSVDGFDFFDSYVRFTVSEQISATLEVFEISAADGSEIHKVQIPVVLLPGQRVIDLNTPAVGDKVCNPVLVDGYSNTFEANVVVTLNQRSGVEITRTTTMGGNLGVYADFSTVISHTAAAPQAVLVSAFEGSPAGFGLIDETRVPISLFSDLAACQESPPADTRH